MTEAEAESAIDAADLAALRESIGVVLTSACTSSALHKSIDGDRSLDADLARQAGELGWLAVGVPEASGGFGLGATGASLLNEELGRVAAPGSFLSALVAAQVLAAASDDEARGLAGQIVAGTALVAIPAALPGDIALHGAAASGQLALLGDPRSTHALVQPTTGGVALVTLDPAAARPRDIWDRTRSLFDVTLDSRPCRLLGSEGIDLARLLERNTAIAVAADCIGIAKGVTARTIAYMQERSQFGRLIGSFQALKHRMADLVARLGIAEQVVAQAVESAAASDEVADMWALLAKAAASEMAVFAAGDCVQLHGGVGFTWEFDVHLFLKRARLNEMLIADNRRLRDRAEALLAAATRAGRSTLDLT